MSEQAQECGPRSLTKTVEKTQEKVDEGRQTLLDLSMRLKEAVRLNGSFKIGGVLPRNGVAKKNGTPKKD